jgi:GNAT superfamily N-acetyltransferase
VACVVAGAPAALGDDDVMTEYTVGVGDIDAGALEGFFAGWPHPPTAHALHRALARSTTCVLAREGEQVVGFVNALSDGALAAYLPLLEVRSDHRGRGIGTELVRRVLDVLSDVYMVDVVCDDSVVPFYERLGLTRLNGMALRNRNASVLHPRQGPPRSQGPAA